MEEYLVFYYWFVGETFPEMFYDYLGDIGDIIFDGRKIEDWTYEVVIGKRGR